MQLTVNRNAKLQLLAMPDWLYFSRPTNIAFHNLTNKSIPVHLRSLLGLGLNYCLRQPSLLGPQTLVCHHFWRDLYTQMIFAGQTSEVPSLYARSDWEPDLSQVPLELQARTNFFLQDVTKHFKLRKASANLLPLQTAAFQYLRSSNQFIVLKTDKNLGPAIMQLSNYRAMAYADHLSHKAIYRQLSLDQATLHLQAV